MSVPSQSRLHLLADVIVCSSQKEETGLERVPVVIMSSGQLPEARREVHRGRGRKSTSKSPCKPADISRINAQILKRKESGAARSPSPGAEGVYGLGSPTGRLHSPARSPNEACFWYS